MKTNMGLTFFFHCIGFIVRVFGLNCIKKNISILILSHGKRLQ